MAVFTAGTSRNVNMDTLDLVYPLTYLGGKSTGTTTHYNTVFNLDTVTHVYQDMIDVYGGWTFPQSPSTNPLLTVAGSGTIDRIVRSTGLVPVVLYEISNMGVPIENAATFLGAPGTYVFAGNDQITGSPFADTLRGYAGADTINGGGGDDQIDGGAGADAIFGGAGSDSITGGPGNDTIDGGDATDAANFSGSSSQYRWVVNGDTVTIVDTRPGSPDGTDTLRSVEVLQFSDRIVTLGSLDALTGAAVNNILRLPAAGAMLDLVQSVGAAADPVIARAAAVQQIIVEARASTSVATLAYEVFTGKIPSAAGLDYLVAPTGGNANNLNSSYYQSFNLENRYINFAVNLGKLGEGAVKFAAEYGSRTLFEATKEAYGTIFGAVPSDEKAHALIDSRIDYFAFYGRDGAEGIGTKAAMVGWLMAEAVKADIGMYAKANDAFLTDLADGAQFQVDMIGVYGQQSFIYHG